MLLPEPQLYESPVEWTDEVSLDVGTYGLVPRLDKPEEWKEWAATVNGFPQISATSPPNPYQFDDWKDWATRFIQSTANLA